ncbi:DUF1589 domain-containing protein [Rhodopirellula europaea]|uniref:DUF1589 domain-containing protein n=1 Tax=Rhodopirellula europaea TaxID=1263866 RepID=UPI003C6E55F6
MLWNKASRPADHARLSDVRPFTPPGATWPTFLSQPDASARKDILRFQINISSRILVR